MAAHGRLLRVTSPPPLPRYRRRGLLLGAIGIGAGTLLSACAPSPVILPDADRSVMPALSLADDRRSAAEAASALGGLAEHCSTLPDADPVFANWCAALAAQHRAHQTVLSQADPLGGVQTDHTPLQQITPRALSRPTDQMAALALLASEEAALAAQLTSNVMSVEQPASMALLWLSQRLAAQVAASALAAGTPQSLGPAPVAGDAVPAEARVGDAASARQVLLGHQRVLVFGLETVLGRLAWDDPMVGVVGDRLGQAMRERDRTAAQISATGATPAPASASYQLPDGIADPTQHVHAWARLELAVLAGWARLAAADPDGREEACEMAFSQAGRVRSLGTPLPYWPGWV